MNRTKTNRMKTNRMNMMKWIAIACVSVAAVGCKQGLGERCQVTADCADGLVLEVGAQVVAGAAWAGLLMGAIAAALALARPGRASGVLFSALALAAFTRIGLTATGAAKLLAPALAWTPAVAWALAGLLLAVVAIRARSRK